MSAGKPRVAIVMPAYNAEQTLRATLAEIPEGFGDHLILVDDCSTDGTVTLARELGLTVIEHPVNRGYGGNQKTCYAAALKTDADVIVMLHPDNQYDARVAPVMVDLNSLGISDVVLGCVSPVGDQGADIARTVVIAAGMPDTVGGFQLNRFCASGLEAVNTAAQKVRSGWDDLVYAGGVESMSRVPMGSDGGAMFSDPATVYDAYIVPH